MKYYHIFAAGSLALLLAGAATPALAARYGYITDDVNLRAGPGRNYPAIYSLSADTIVQVEGCLRDRSWCDVALKVKKKHNPWRHGWVSGRYLQYAYMKNNGRYYIRQQPVEAPSVIFDIIAYWDNYYRGEDFYRDRDHYMPRDWRNDRRRDRDDDRDWDDDDNGRHRSWDRDDDENIRWND